MPFNLSRLAVRKLLWVPGLALMLLAGGLRDDPALALPAAGARVIVNAMEYPWSAIGRVNTGGRSYCTGVLIGERHVLTEARCLFYGVEGRWWNPSELHFVAGYQRDSYRIHSPVTAYSVAPGFRGGAGQTLANATNNWALLTLAKPIGREAGWIAMQWLDHYATDRLARGEAYALEAGYRMGQAHVVTVSLDCSIGSLARRLLINRGACATLVAESGLSTLLFIDGEFRVLGTQLMRRDASLRVFGEATAAAGRSPEQPSPAAALPHETVRQLLDRLGYLGQGQGEAGAAETRAAIMAFQGDQGLPVTGEPTIDLLGRLIVAVN